MYEKFEELSIVQIGPHPFADEKNDSSRSILQSERRHCDVLTSDYRSQSLAGQAGNLSSLVIKNFDRDFAL